VDCDRDRAVVDADRHRHTADAIVQQRGHEQFAPSATCLTVIPQHKQETHGAVPLRRCGAAAVV